MRQHKQCGVAQTGLRLDVPARIGGDEFVVLFAETGEDQVQAAIQRFKEILKAEITAHRWQLSASIGVVTFRREAPEAQNVLEVVDGAMCRAKLAGKDRAHFSVA